MQFLSTSVHLKDVIVVTSFKKRKKRKVKRHSDLNNSHLYTCISLIVDMLCVGVGGSRRADQSS